MSKVDKIFKEERYFEESHNKEKILIYNQYNLLVPSKSIMFFPKFKGIKICEYNKNTITKSICLTPQEIKAMYQKAKELGFYE